MGKQYDFKKGGREAAPSTTTQREEGKQHHPKSERAGSPDASFGGLSNTQRTPPDNPLEFSPGFIDLHTGPGRTYWCITVLEATRPSLRPPHTPWPSLQTQASTSPPATWLSSGCSAVLLAPLTLFDLRICAQSVAGISSFSAALTLATATTLTSDDTWHAHRMADLGVSPSVALTGMAPKLQHTAWLVQQVTAPFKPRPNCLTSTPWRTDSTARLAISNGSTTTLSATNSDARWDSGTSTLAYTADSKPTAVLMLASSAADPSTSLAPRHCLPRAENRSTAPAALPCPRAFEPPREHHSSPRTPRARRHEAILDIAVRPVWALCPVLLDLALTNTTTRGISTTRLILFQRSFQARDQTLRPATTRHSPRR